MGSKAKARGLHWVAGGFAMAEGPRWHDGAVVLTDIHAGTIERIDEDGTVTTLAELPTAPISTGFLSDATMLVSGMAAARLWRVTDGVLSVYADLAGISTFDWGDIVVDAHDRVYVANQGISYPQNIPDSIDSRIYLVVPNAAPRQVAGGFRYANGLAITPDERSLIIAESFGHSLWRMPIQVDGSLGTRQLVVRFPHTDRPDGICCDAEGAVWSANATGRAVLRCTPEGTITDRICTGDDLAIGCILGGAGGCDLYITTAPTADRTRARELRSSALWRTRVDVPAGGRP